MSQHSRSHPAGSLITSAFHLSLAAHLSLYPVLLLPPLILVAHLATNSPASVEHTPRSRVNCAVEGVLAFAGHQAVLLALSRWLTGSWAFLSSVYGVMCAPAKLFSCSTSADPLDGPAALRSPT